MERVPSDLIHDGFAWVKPLRVCETLGTCSPPSVPAWQTTNSANSRPPSSHGACTVRSDPRRFCLGDATSGMRDSRHLLTAIGPRLADDEFRQLEAAILTWSVYRPI